MTAPGFRSRSIRAHCEYFHNLTERHPGITPGAQPLTAWEVAEKALQLVLEVLRDAGAPLSDQAVMVAVATRKGVQERPEVLAVLFFAHHFRSVDRLNLTALGRNRPAASRPRAKWRAADGGRRHLVCTLCLSAQPEPRRRAALTLSLLVAQRSGHTGGRASSRSD